MLKLRINQMRRLLITLLFVAVLVGCTRKDQAFTFVQICDTQIGMVDYETDMESFRKAVEKINVLNPDFVIICGDLVNRNNEKSYADFNEIKAGFSMPCYCVPGNHDVGDKPTNESLAYYRETVGDDYFSFTHKGATFVLVNTQLWKAPVKDETEKQDIWFENTLKAAAGDGNRIIIAGHFPLFLENPDEGDDYFAISPGKRRKILGLLEQYNVNVMIGGHTHRTIINEYNGIQFVNAESTCRNIDERPLGFRVWHIEGELPFKHEFFPVIEPDSANRHQ